jgi:probable phosphoglycerate mutase
VSTRLIPAVVDDLREMDCGELEGRTDDAAWEALDRVVRRWLACDFSAGFPGGETYGDAVLRFKRVLAWASAEAAPLLVTHGGIATTVIPLLCVNAAAMQRLDGLDNTGFVILDVYDPGRYVCEAWNLVEHLD